jgi:hypothetical protein
MAGVAAANHLTPPFPKTENINGAGATPKYKPKDVIPGSTDATEYGPYGWTYTYQRSFDGNKITKHLEIDFKFDADVPDAEKDAFKKNVESNIEGVWNNKFAVLDPTNGKKYPAVLDITLTGPFDQTVQVHKASTAIPTDLSNWSTADTNNTQAHEVGHMLGLYDEYVGGAIKIPNPTISNDGVMGYGGARGATGWKMYDRYYQQYADFMNSLHGQGGFKLVTVPLPSALLLGPLGFALMLAARKRVFAKAA